MILGSNEMGAPDPEIFQHVYLGCRRLAVATLLHTNRVMGCATKPI